MSHSSGEITQGETIIGYIEWNGTCDCIASTRIRASLDEVSEHWRKGDFPDCTCGQPHEDGLLYEGFYHFPVKFCRSCMLVTSETLIDLVREAHNQCADCGGLMGNTCNNWSHKSLWPKRGHPFRKDE